MLPNLLCVANSSSRIAPDLGDISGPNNHITISFIWIYVLYCLRHLSAASYFVILLIFPFHSSLVKLRRPLLKLKNKQHACIEAFMTGTDVFPWLPTGYRKSLCYQALPFVYDYIFRPDRLSQKSGSTVIVICPLISLMIDQVKHKVDVSAGSYFVVWSGCT